MVGFHFVGPNAGEITQGFSLAVRLGAKKVDFDKLVSVCIFHFLSHIDLSCVGVHVRTIYHARYPV